MSQDCVVAIYDSFDKAKKGIQALETAAFPPDQVSFVTHDVDRETSDEDEEALQYGDESGKKAAQGAGAGGLLGVLLGTPLLLVGGGPVLIAGPIAMGLTGAVVGGILGAMGGWGVHTDHIRQYEEKLADGALLVIVNGDPREVAEAERVLQETDCEKVHLHAKTSADSVEP